MNMDRKGYYYESTLKAQDLKIKTALKELAERYPEYGFKKLYGLLPKEAGRCNHKRVHRLYCELGLNLKRKPKKRLAPRTPETLEQPRYLNECWSLDFMSDALIHGRRFRTLNVLDDCNREGLGIKVAFSLPAQQVIHFLNGILADRGKPEMIRVDNGPENISTCFQTWAKEKQIKIRYIQPGKTAQNGYIERFNRSYREAILDRYLFENIHQVQRLSNEWLKHYNEERPHEALKNKTPREIARQLQQIPST